MAKTETKPAEAPEAAAPTETPAPEAASPAAGLTTEQLLQVLETSNARAIDAAVRAAAAQPSASGPTVIIASEQERARLHAIEMAEAMKGPRRDLTCPGGVYLVGSVYVNSSNVPYTPAEVERLKAEGWIK